MLSVYYAPKRPLTSRYSYFQNEIRVYYYSRPVSRFVTTREKGNMSLKQLERTDSARVVIEGCVLSDRAADDLRSLLQRRIPWMKGVWVSVHRGYGVTITFKPTDKLWELADSGKTKGDDLCAKLNNWLSGCLNEGAKIYIISPYVPQQSV